MLKIIFGRECTVSGESFVAISYYSADDVNMHCTKRVEESNSVEFSVLPTMKILLFFDLTIGVSSVQRAVRFTRFNGSREYLLGGGDSVIAANVVHSEARRDVFHYLRCARFDSTGGDLQALLADTQKSFSLPNSPIKPLAIPLFESLRVQLVDLRRGAVVSTVLLERLRCGMFLIAFAGRRLLISIEHEEFESIDLNELRAPFDQFVAKLHPTVIQCQEAEENVYRAFLASNSPTEQRQENSSLFSDLSEPGAGLHGVSETSGLPVSVGQRDQGLQTLSPELLDNWPGDRGPTCGGDAEETRISILIAKSVKHAKESRNPNTSDPPPQASRNQFMREKELLLEQSAQAGAERQEMGSLREEDSKSDVEGKAQEESPDPKDGSVGTRVQAGTIATPECNAAALVINDGKIASKLSPEALSLNDLESSRGAKRTVSDGYWLEQSATQETEPAGSDTSLQKTRESNSEDVHNSMTATNKEQGSQGSRDLLHEMTENSTKRNNAILPELASDEYEEEGNYKSKACDARSHEEAEEEGQETEGTATRNAHEGEKLLKLSTSADADHKGSKEQGIEFESLATSDCMSGTNPKKSQELESHYAVVHKPQDSGFFKQEHHENSNQGGGSNAGYLVGDVNAKLALINEKLNALQEQEQANKQEKYIQRQFALGVSTHGRLQQPRRSATSLSYEQKVLGPLQQISGRHNSNSPGGETPLNQLLPERRNAVILPSGNGQIYTDGKAVFLEALVLSGDTLAPQQRELKDWRAVKCGDFYFPQPAGDQPVPGLREEQNALQNNGVPEAASPDERRREYISSDFNQKSLQLSCLENEEPVVDRVKISKMRSELAYVEAQKSTRFKPRPMQFGKSGQ